MVGFFRGFFFIMDCMISSERNFGGLKRGGGGGWGVG